MAEYEDLSLYEDWTPAWSNTSLSADHSTLSSLGDSELSGRHSFLGDIDVVVVRALVSRRLKTFFVVLALVWVLAISKR